MLQRLFNALNGSGRLTAGGHSIQANSVMTATDATVVTPSNPQIGRSIRTTPVVPAPRYFNAGEAAALESLAKIKQAEAKTTVQAYAALGKVETSDAVVHEAHRGYQTVVATQELRKKTADAQLAKSLHGLRPAYARLQQGIHQADSRANEAIARIRSRMAEL